MIDIEKVRGHLGNLWGQTSMSDIGSKCELDKALTELERLQEKEVGVKEVYIIMSPEGGIGLDISTSKGNCYTDLEQANKKLEGKNKWSLVKGYGVYEIITLQVIENED